MASPRFKKYRRFRLDHSRFASAIWTRRRAGGHPQKEVALLLGISISQYSRIETCASFPTAEQFLTLCYLFDLEPQSFLIEMETKQ